MRIAEATPGRGGHPKINTNTKQLWHFDAASPVAGVNTLVAGGLILNQSGSPAIDQTAPIGEARRFNRATPNYFNQVSGGGEDASSLTNNGFTVSFWVKPHYTYGNHGWVVGYARSGGPSLATNMVFGCRVDSDLKLTMRWQHGAGGTTVTSTSTAALLSKGKWSHVLWTFDAISTLKLYVNGTLAQTWTGLTGPEVAGAGNTQRYAMGIRADDLTTEPFDGWLCSVEVSGDSTPSTDSIEERFWRGMAWVHGSTVHWKIEVEDGAGDFRELTALSVVTGTSQEDVVLDVDFDDDVDAVMTTAHVTCIRDFVHGSLSKYHDNPLNRTPTTGIGPNDTTYTENTTELIALNRRARIYWARCPFDLPRSKIGSSEWQKCIEGRIKNVQWPKDTMQLTLVDEIGHRLNRSVIRDEGTKYGDTATPPTTTFESVMQSLLNDGNTNGWIDDDPDTGAATTLVTPTSPGANKYQYQPRRESYMQHLTWLANMIGWKVKTLWDPSVSKFRLHFYEPAREKVGADAVVPNDFMVNLNELELDDAGIRNVCRVTYYPRPQTESVDPGAPSPPSGFTATHTWDAANDANAVDGTSGYATRTWKHTASIAKYGEVFMEFGEGSASAIDRAQEADTLAENALRDSAEPKMSHQAQAMLFPEIEVGDVIRWKGYPVVGSGSQANVPYTSDQTLAVVSVRHAARQGGEGSDIFCRGTPCGQNKGWIDADTSRPGGSPPAPTAGAQLQTDMASRYRRGALFELTNTSQLVRGNRGALVFNPDFSERRFNNGLWDGWELAAGTFNSNILNDTTDVLSGRNSVKITNGIPELRSRYIPVQGSKTYSAEAWAKTSSSATFLLGIVWYDSARSVISSPTISNATQSTSWKRSHGHVTAPSNARWAKLALLRPAGVGNLFIDRVSLIPTHPMARAYQASTTPVTLTDKAWNQVTFDTESYDYDGIFNLSSDQIEIDVDGKYNIHAHLRLLPNAGSGTVKGLLGLNKNGTPTAGQPCWINGMGDMVGTINGAFLHVRAEGVPLLAGDTVTVWVWPMDGGGLAPRYAGDSDGGFCWVSVRHVTQEG